MQEFDINASHSYSFSGRAVRRLVAYRSETAGHVSVFTADVAWNVHHMEKLIMPLYLYSNN